MVDDVERASTLRALAERLELTFGDLTLLDRALTHASTTSDRAQAGYDYESLEFLGDAALGLAVAHYLYAQVPDRTPGEYSRMRAGLVNRRCLARIATELGIAPHIRLGKGEERAGGRKREALLADCLEALIGAVYLDQGWSRSRDLVDAVFADEYLRERHDQRVWDFKSRLQHHCQSLKWDLPEFKVVHSTGPDHRKEFDIEVVVQGKPTGRGLGRSKKEAEQAAAKAALEAEGYDFSQP